MMKKVLKFVSMMLVGVFTFGGLTTGVGTAVVLGSETSVVEEQDFSSEGIEVSTAALPAIPVVVSMILKFGYQWAVKAYGKSTAKKAMSSAAYAAAKSLPKSILKNGKVDINGFTRKQGSTWVHPKSGWKISKERGNGHGGSAWKVLNKNGDRKATIDKNGTVLRK